MQSNFRLYNPYVFILLFKISLFFNNCLSLYRNMWHVYSPQYTGHDDLSYSHFAPVYIGQTILDAFLYIKIKNGLLFIFRFKTILSLNLTT